MELIEREIEKEKIEEEEKRHPLEEWLRMDRIPHIWCSTCGIGTAVTCFIEAIKKTKIPVNSSTSGY